MKADEDASLQSVEVSMLHSFLLLPLIIEVISSCISTSSPDGLPSVTTTPTTTTTTPDNSACQLCPDPYACDPSIPSCIAEGSLSPPPVVTRGSGQCTFTIMSTMTIYYQATTASSYTPLSTGTSATFTCGDYPNDVWKLPDGVTTFVHVAVGL